MQPRRPSLPAPCPRDDDLAPSARLAEDVGRRDYAAIAERHGLATLQHAPLATGRDAQPIGDLDVEPSGPPGLDERVADRRNPVLDLERRDLVAVAPRVARPARFPPCAPDT